MNEIKLAIRNLSHQKIYSTINILGLSIAFIVSVILFLFVHFHFSFDKHIPDKNKSYRLVSSLGEGSKWASTFTAFEDILPHCSEVKAHSVFYKNDEHFDIENGSLNYTITDPVYADPDFIQFFNIRLSSGNAEDLCQPNTVLISEEASKALFKNENPIGKSIRITYLTNAPTPGTRNSTVVGVFAANQYKSHLKYDLIHSKKGFYDSTINRIKPLKVYGAYVYITLHDNASKDTFEAGLTNLLTPSLGNSFGPQIEDFKTTLQPVSDIHFTTEIVRDLSVGINKSHLLILLLIGCLLFATTTFNFLIMNISTSESRISQSKIIRFMGGSKSSLLKTHFWEVTIVTVISLLISILSIWLLMPIISKTYFNGWRIESGSLYYWVVISALSMLIIFASTLSTGLTSIRIARQKNSNPTNRGSLKIIPLIVFQFIVVITLICFGTVIKKQLNFIGQKDLGYASENIMLFSVPGGRSSKINTFKQRAGNVPGVIAASNVQHYPGFRLQDLTLETLKGSFPIKFAMVDEDALKVLNLKLVERFSKLQGNEIFVNETLYKAFQKSFTQDEIVNGDFNSKQQGEDEKLDFYVNGVVNDFNYNSLYEPLGNFMFIIRKTSEFNHRFLMVRYNLTNTKQVISGLQNIEEELYNVKTDPIFLNEELNKAYESEQLILSITGLFASLTILITCLGLFAFSIYTTQIRTKEIGIRKVNGAKTSEIIGNLSFSFIKWILVAFIIATPIAYYAMNRWLENFAYKTELSWWIFALAGVLALGIALLTVSVQSWKAATRNPIESLRYE